MREVHSRQMKGTLRAGSSWRPPSPAGLMMLRIEEPDELSPQAGRV